MLIFQPALYLCDLISLCWLHSFDSLHRRTSVLLTAPASSPIFDTSSPLTSLLQLRQTLFICKEESKLKKSVGYCFSFFLTWSISLKNDNMNKTRMKEQNIVNKFDWQLNVGCCGLACLVKVTSGSGVSAHWLLIIDVFQMFEHISHQSFFSSDVEDLL